MLFGHAQILGFFGHTQIPDMSTIIDLKYIDGTVHDKDAWTNGESPLDGLAIYPR